MESGNWERKRLWAFVHKKMEVTKDTSFNKNTPAASQALGGGVHAGEHRAGNKTEFVFLLMEQMFCEL